MHRQNTQSYFISTLYKHRTQEQIERNDILNAKKCYISSAFKNVNILRMFLYDDIEIIEDPLLNGEEQDDYLSFDERRNQVYRWSELTEYFYKYTTQMYVKNYDRYYLENAIEDVCMKGCQTLIVGSSYARFGFEDRLADFYSKNLSLKSQDIFYASLIAKEMLDLNRKIKRVIFGLGYTTIFSDLSRTQNLKEKSRISHVYYPLFHNMHNATLLPETYSLIQSDVWNIQQIISCFSQSIYLAGEGEYFHSGYQRFYQKLCLWKDARTWQMLSETEKEDIGKSRAQSHNKSFGRWETLWENVEILEELLFHCKQQEADIIFCVFPMTQYYMRYLNPCFERVFNDILNRWKSEIRIIDLKQYESFNDEDFIDMDHFSDEGAAKATKILNGILAET